MDRRGFLKTSVLFGAAAGLGTMHQSCVSASDNFDILVKGGTVFDGSGKPGVKADLGIRDGRIAAIGTDLGKSARQVLDARGLTVAPGFIDIHSHTDTKLMSIPRGDSRIFQGVTTEVGGNCGDAPFVFSDEAWERRKDKVICGHKAWRDVDGFYDALRDGGIGINYASLVGHGDLRRAVVGVYNVKATDEQVRAMCDILDRQLSLGAIGLSFGLEYAPGCYCDTREMVELCKVVAKHDKLYSIHLRNEAGHVIEAMEEAIEAARQSGARLEISHLKAQNPANFDKLPQMLALVDAARAEGIDIAFDRYPYTAFATGLTNLIPQSLRDGTGEDILKRLDDPAACAVMRENALRCMDNFGGPDKVVIAACSLEENQAYSGRSVAECCSISGLDPWEMVRHLLKSERLNVNQATFAMKEDNLKTLYRHPLSMPGSDGSVYSPEQLSGDSLPHPRAYGTFARFFGKFVREDAVLDMQTAVWKCTGLPASRLKLKERGMLLPGYAADVTVFDAGTIADKATYAKPHVFAEGIRHVIVGGRTAITDGGHTGVLNGEVLA